jgi:outer membrane protein assembly factor BamA
MPPPGQTELRVKGFKIEGNDQFPDSEIKEGLATEEDSAWRTSISWMPVLGAQPSFFNQIHWKHDLQRIRAFYKRHGYFDAKIVTENIIKRPKRDAVYLSLKIKEGKPTTVHNISLHGIEFFDRLEPDELKSGLSVQPKEIFTELDYLNAKTEIAAKLKNQGFAYAEVRGRVNVEPKKHSADVYFFIDLGPPSYFGDVDIRGLEKVKKESIDQYLSIESGKKFRGSALSQTREKLYGLDVFSIARVIPKYRLQEREEAKEGDSPAKMKLQRGLKSRLSRRQIDVEGQLQKPKSKLQKKEEKKQRQAAEPLGVRYFLSGIQAKAKKQAQRDPEVPVVVKLKETRLLNVEVGTGFSVESNRQEVELQGNWSHKNFLGGLRRLEHFNRVGYALALDRDSGSFAPTALFTGGDAIRNEGVILTSRLQMTQPAFLEEKTRLRVAPSINRDIDIGYRFWNPSFTIGLNRQIWGPIEGGISYNFSYYTFDNIDPALTGTTALGDDFQEEFVLETLKQDITVDLRDSPLNPTRGTFYRLAAQEASGYALGGEFDFLKFTAETEGYIPFELGTEWVTALRGELGTIYNLESPKTNSQGEVTTQNVPTLKRLYSGGKNQMRSFGRNQISLYRVRQSQRQGQRSAVPVGGLTKIEASFEQRFRLVEKWVDVGDVWGAAFFDSASVLRGQLLQQTDASRSLQNEEVGISDIGDSLLHGVGAGLWWETPLGPIRGDFAYTLTDITTDSRFRTCQGAASNGQTTGTADCQYVSAGQDPVLSLIPKYSFYIGLGHSF